MCIHPNFPSSFGRNAAFCIMCKAHQIAQIKGCPFWMCSEAWVEIYFVVAKLDFVHLWHFQLLKCIFLYMVHPYIIGYFSSFLEDSIRWTKRLLIFISYSILNQTPTMARNLIEFLMLRYKMPLATYIKILDIYHPSITLKNI